MMKMKANVRINAANGLNGAAILGQRPVIAYRQSARMCPALKFPSPMSAVPAIAHGLAFCLGVKKDKKIPAEARIRILSCLSLQAGYVASCRAFSAAFDGEGHFLTFVQRFVTLVLDSREVYEHVF